MTAPAPQASSCASASGTDAITAPGAGTDAEPRSESGGSGTSTLTCVFAVRNSPDAAAPAARGHTRGGPLRLLALPGALWAVAQDVPAPDFTEEALRRRLSDPHDLEACARAHHAVVTAAAAGGPVVPLPLATLFTDDERAAAALDEQRTSFLAVLDRVAGRSEWAVKVHVRPTPPDTGHCDAPGGGDGRRGGPSGATVGSSRPGPGAGMAYLNRVRDRERDRDVRQEAAVRAARRVYDTAAAFAVDAVRRRPHGVEITGRDRPQVLNAAFLVEDARARDLVAAVRALDGAFPGLDVHTDVSGPWVPYSFTGGAGS